MSYTTFESSLSALEVDAQEALTVFNQASEALRAAEEVVVAAQQAYNEAGDTLEDALDEATASKVEVYAAFAAAKDCDQSVYEGARDALLSARNAVSICEEEVAQARTSVQAARTTLQAAKVAQHDALAAAALAERAYVEAEEALDAAEVTLVFNEVNQSMEVYLAGSLAFVMYQASPAAVSNQSLLESEVVEVGAIVSPYLLAPAVAQPVCSEVTHTTTKAMNLFTALSVATFTAAIVARAFRPAASTRRAMKAVSRKAMVKASRKANRVARTSSRRPVRTSSHAARSARRTTRAAKVAVRTLRQLAVASVATYIKVALYTPSNARCQVSAPVLCEPVQGCALPRPTLKDKVKVVPLAMQRPVIRAYRPSHAAIRAVSADVVEVVIVPTTPTLSLAQKLASHAARMEAKAAATAQQAANIIAKAEKKALAAIAKATKASTPKASKAKGKEPKKSVTSQRKGAHNLVIAGPTNGDDYGYTPMSDNEFYSFIYGEECTPTNQPAVRNLSTSHELYNIVVCILGAGKVPPSVVGQAAAIQSNNTPQVNMQAPTNNGIKAATSIKPITNVNLMNLNGEVVNPAKALTTMHHAIPEDWFLMETSRINYSTTKLSVSGTYTHIFSGLGGTISILNNGDNNTLFVKNSHPRLYKVIGDPLTSGKVNCDSTEYIFSSFMENVLNASVAASNQAALVEVEELAAFYEQWGEAINQAIEEGTVESEEQFLEDMGIEKPVVSTQKPVRYIVMVAERVQKDGKWVYEYNTQHLLEEEAIWVSKGYEVVAINSTLTISNLSVENFRLNGCIPCVSCNPADIDAMGIKKWDAENYHQAVKPVTDLAQWLHDLMATGKVKSMSISFNNITPLRQIDSVDSNKKKTIAHEYGFTTPESQYEERGVDGNVPAFTINLWTTAVKVDGIAPEAVVKEAATTAKVFTPKYKAPTSTISDVLDIRVTPGSILSQKLAMKEAQETAKVEGRKAPVPANQARKAEQVIKPTTTIVSPLPITTAPAPLEEPKAADSVNEQVSALNDDYGDIFDDVDECQKVALNDITMPTSYLANLEALCVDLGITVQAMSSNGVTFGSPVTKAIGIYATNTIQVQEDLSDNHRAQVLLHELMHYVSDHMDADTAEEIYTDWLDNVGLSGNTPANSSMEEQFAYSFMQYAHDIDTLASFIKSVVSGDDTWAEYYNTLQTAITVSNAVTLDTAPIAIVTDKDAAPATNHVLDALGKIGAAPIVYPTGYLEALKELSVKVSNMLPANYQYKGKLVDTTGMPIIEHIQTLLYIQAHTMIALVTNPSNDLYGDDAVELPSSWLVKLGEDTSTSDSEHWIEELVEQFACSFINYAHNLDTLLDVFTGIVGLYHKPYMGVDAEANLKAGELYTAAFGKLVASAKASKGKVRGRHLLVMASPSGKLPAMYQQAFPTLKVPAQEIGSYYTTDINGVVVHAICGANEEGNVIYPIAIDEALKAIVRDMGAKQLYICEQDLGFGDNIGTTSRIMGTINNVLGKRAQIISAYAMKRAAKQWNDAGAQPTYPKADLSLWSTALTTGTALVAVAIGGVTVDGTPHGMTDSAMTIKMAVLDADNKVDAAALQAGLEELETAIADGIVPMPIYVYSCQQDAFKDISVGVKVVEYSEGAFLDKVKVGVLSESPIEGMDLETWYNVFTHTLNTLNSKGTGQKVADGLLGVTGFSRELYTEAFGDLAAYAISPVPLAWLEQGIILVVPGKAANGLIEKAVKYEELIDKSLLQALVGNGVKVYTAEWVFDKTTKKRVIKGKNASIYGEFGYHPLPDGDEGESMLCLKDNECEFVNGNVIGMEISNKAVHTLDQYMQKHLLDTIQYIIDTQGVGMAIRYMEVVLPKFVKKVEPRAGKVRYHLGVYNKAKQAEYYMEFTEVEGKSVDNWDYLSPKHCEIHSSSKDLEVNKITNLSGFPDTMYDGVTVAIGLAISAASGRQMTQDVLEGYLASTTNLWARADNYGLKLTTMDTPAGYSISDALRVIIDNSGKTISSTPNQNIDAKGTALGREAGARWPYHMPCNAALDLSLMESLMAAGELVMCDKYAMDRVIIGDGARAMLAAILTPEQAERLNGFNDNIALEVALNPINGNSVYTVCWPVDKASKALNRPSQFHGATQADAWKEELEWSALTTDLGNNKRSGVRGFKIQIIAAVTDFLSQGSGAASMYSKTSRRISYSVPGTMRATMDWTDVPAVQQNLNDKGEHKLGLAPSPLLYGPKAGEGPSGKDKEGKEVPALKWFCGSFKDKILVPAIEAAMYTNSTKSEYRIYEPGEEIVVLFDKDVVIGKEFPGFYPNGTTPGLDAARKVVFTNDLGMQKCIVTGYRFQFLENGERLQVILTYATVSDSEADNWSGAKLRGDGIKAILSYDDTIMYIGTAPYNGVNTDLNELYRNGAVHFTSEGLKGNYAFKQGFAAAHGAARMSGPYLIIDQYLMDGTENEYYVEGHPDMISDLTDTESYFYRWVRDNTRCIRMQKTLSQEDWNYIRLCNADKDGNIDLPGLVIVSQDDTRAIAWDSKGGEQEVSVTPSITVEYDVQVLVFDYWAQVEVADPGACTGSQGMTGEQAANLSVMLDDTVKALLDRGANKVKGVENAVESARIHAMVEAGYHVDGIFNFNPKEASHNALMRQLQYKVSDTGVYTPRPVREFYILLASLFGGAAMDTTKLWTDMLNGDVSHIDYIDEKVVTFSDGYNYLDEVKGLRELVEEGLEYGFTGKGLCISTTSENTELEVTNTITYIDPTVFLQLGAFESVLVAADPSKHEPSKRVTGAATGIVSDIYKAFQAWGSVSFWLRNGADSRVHGKNCQLRKSMLGWIGVNSKQHTMMNAKGVLSRIGRIDSHAGMAGKVCTGIGYQYAPHIIFNADGTTTEVPVAIFHPDCLLAKGLKHGDVVGIGRTPTVSLAFCVVKFSRAYGRIGYIHMSFSVWAKGNNGDTDGDPCNRVLVGTFRKGQWRGVNYQHAAKLNKHALGMGGYDVVCGPNPRTHDCAEFVSFKDVWTKKALNNQLIPAAIAEWVEAKGMKVKGLEPLVYFMLPATLLDSAQKVSRHYRANVGVAYGWCSAYSAHMKEKHSFLELVVSTLLKTVTTHPQFAGVELPTTADMMEALIDGNASKHYIIDLLCQYKADPTTKNPMDIVEMGQHIRIMLQASAWLWRGVYEGLGLSGYSPKAHAFFETFTIALRNKGLVADASIVDDNGKVTLVQPAKPAKDGTGMSVSEFLSKYYDMPLDVANEIYAACLLYNGYRAIERGLHIPGEDDKQPTTYETYKDLYTTAMSQWKDTRPEEYEKHSILAGVFRRAGQGTTGVSIDDEMSSSSTAKMIYTFAQEKWAAYLNTLGTANPVAIFVNPMLNDIATKSVVLYNKLVDITKLGSDQ